jgi:hypothetical protein
MMSENGRGMSGAYFEGRKHFNGKPGGGMMPANRA